MQKAAGWKRPPACSPWSELLPTRRVHRTPTRWKQSKVNTNIKGRISPLFLGDPIIPQVRVCTAQSTAAVPVFRGACGRMAKSRRSSGRASCFRSAPRGSGPSHTRPAPSRRSLPVLPWSTTPCYQRRVSPLRSFQLCYRFDQKQLGFTTEPLPKHHVDGHQHDCHHAGPECRPGKQRIGAFRRQRRPLLQ